MFCYVMKEKLHLHDGTVTVELDRLVEIPRTTEPPEVRIEKVLHLQVNCTCVIASLDM